MLSVHSNAQSWACREHPERTEGHAAVRACKNDIHAVNAGTGLVLDMQRASISAPEGHAAVWVQAAGRHAVHRAQRQVRAPDLRAPEHAAAQPVQASWHAQGKTTVHVLSIAAACSSLSHSAECVRMSQPIRPKICLNEYIF